MIWFLVLHIVALLFWCAALLYLPLMLLGLRRKQLALTEVDFRSDSLPRFFFTRIVTPSALLAIMAGTVVFLLNQQVEIWLIAKLTLVAGLVVAHALCGVLVLRYEQRPEAPLTLFSYMLFVICLLLMLAIVWLVLAKPEFGWVPWPL